jgi:hypothetical protein
VVDEGATVIMAPFPTDPVCDELGYQVHAAPVPSEPPMTDSVTWVSLQIGWAVDAATDTMTPVAATDAPGAPVQLTHCVPLQAPDWHITGAGVEQAPFRHVDWAVVFPAVQDGPAPHMVEDDLLLALQTAVPVEQSMAPVWHAVLMPVVHDAPDVHALQVPVLSHTPAADAAIHAEATAERVHVPVVQVWHVPHAVAQQTPETHWPCAHWLFAEHGFPSAMVGAQAPPAPQ